MVQFQTEEKKKRYKIQIVSYFIAILLCFSAFLLVIYMSFEKYDMTMVIQKVNVKTNAFKVVNMKDGLGNQFFIYSFAYVLQNEIEFPVYIDLEFYLECKNRSCISVDTCNNVKNPEKRQFGLCYYNISLPRATSQQIEKAKNSSLITDYQVLKNGLSSYNTPNIQYFSGYFENLGYYDFDKYRKYFLQEFTFLGNITGKCNEILELIKSTNSVALHVRRTDHKHHGTASVEYFINATNYINEHVKDPHYFIFF